MFEALFWMGLGGFIYYFVSGKGSLEIGEEILLNNGRRVTVVDSKDLEDMMDGLLTKFPVSKEEDEDSLI